MDDVILRPYREGDEAAINQGFNLAFGLARSLDEWLWKFPAGSEGRWIVVAVNANGQVLAHCGAMVARMRLGAVTVRGAQIEGAFAVQDAQGRRVFTSCYEEFIRRFGTPDDLPFMYGFPGERRFEMGIKDLHDQDLGPVGFWSHELGRRKLVTVTGHRVRRGWDRAAADALWSRAAGRYPYATLRDGAWLERRFTGHPAAVYTHLSAWRAGMVRAWAVVARAGAVLKVADLIWDGDDARALAALARAIDAEARAGGCRTVQLWLGGDPAAGATLSWLGYVESPHPDGLHTAARIFHPEIDLDKVRRRLYLTLGDSDMV